MVLLFPHHLQHSHTTTWNWKRLHLTQTHYTYTAATTKQGEYWDRSKDSTENVSTTNLLLSQVNCPPPHSPLKGLEIIISLIYFIIGITEKLRLNKAITVILTCKS